MKLSLHTVYQDPAINLSLENMKAWFVSNAFLCADSFREIEQSFLVAADKLGIELTLKTNAEVLCKISAESGLAEDEKPDFVLFWDKDVRLASYLERQGIRVYNSARAIEFCDDKSLMYTCLSENNVSIPKTILAPMTYAGCGYGDFTWLTPVIDELGFPLVLKECFGSWGEQVHLIEDEHTLRDRLSEVSSRPVLFQEFVEESFGRDIRVYVIGQKCEVALLRTSPPDTFLSNRVVGSQAQLYTISEEEEATALRSISALGLDFGSVDLFCGDKHNPLVCEVNSNIQFSALEQLENSKNFAKQILQFAVRDVE